MKQKSGMNFMVIRYTILASYDNKCCVTGISIPELLVSSHIVPWSKDEINRLNPHNGLCLNLLHDKAFDRGLMTITEDYKIKLSTAIICYEAIEKFFLPYDNHSIFLPNKFLPDKRFLKYHYENIFRKN